MTRQVIQMRPKGQPGAAMYSPQRDLANIYPNAMREAVLGLDQVNWRDYFAGWLESANLTEADLAEGVRLFVEAHRSFVGDPAITTPADAFVQVGFFALPRPVILTLYARLGEVMAGGFFVALRDVTARGDLPPNIAEIADFMAAGRVMAERLTGQAKVVPDEDRMQFESFKLQIREQQQANDKLRELHRLVCRDLRDISSQLDTYKSHLCYLKGRTLWMTLQDWWGWWWSPPETATTSKS